MLAWMLWIQVGICLNPPPLNPHHPFDVLTQARHVAIQGAFRRVHRHPQRFIPQAHQDHFQAVYLLAIVLKRIDAFDETLKFGVVPVIPVKTARQENGRPR